MFPRVVQGRTCPTPRLRGLCNDPSDLWSEDVIASDICCCFAENRAAAMGNIGKDGKNGRRDGALGTQGLKAEAFCRLLGTVDMPLDDELDTLLETSPGKK